MKEFDAPPGVLVKDQIVRLVGSKAISCTNGAPKNPDASAIDLPIADKAWKLPSALRPTKLELHEITSRRPIEPVDGAFTFEPNTPYLVELDHYLDLPENVSGRATGRSSVGRLDVITRLIAKDGLEYDLIPSKYEGKLHLLVLPQTFAIKVEVGTALNQLRLFCGSHFDALISRASVPHYGTPFWYRRSGGNFIPWPQEDGDHEKRLRSSLIEDPYQLDLTVDLSEQEEGYIFRARKDQEEPVDLSIKTNDPAKYFTEERVKDEAVTLERGQFYILKSRERLHIPNTVAVEVVAISERIGDIRIHYAGFAHPEFGRDRPDDGKKGTPLIFEVRSTDMDTKLQHGALLARVQLFRTSLPYLVPPEDRRKSDPKDYSGQELQLSNYFSEWKRP